MCSWQGLDHTPQRLSPIAYEATVILNNPCDVATATTTISSISVVSEAVVKTEHVVAVWHILRRDRNVSILLPEDPLCYGYYKEPILK